MAFVSLSDHTKPVTDIKIWGKSGWRFLMAIAMAYPSKPTADKKRAMRNFLESLAQVLPCNACGMHFRDAIKGTLTQESLQSKNQLLRWMHDAQNGIRRRQKRAEVNFNQTLRECFTGSRDASLVHITYRQGAIILATIVAILLIYISLRKK